MSDISAHHVAFVFEKIRKVKMMEDKIRITTETGSRLVGALIGLVRATDGAVNVTDDTYNIIIEGLHISDISLGCTDADTEKMIEKAHADKQTIVPDCSVCGAPCGRTADYDWESVYREKQTEHTESNSNGNVAERSTISNLRLDILARLQKISHRVTAGELKADDELNFSVCRAVFALGEDWSASELEGVARELDGFMS